jgi:hypothetical protein
MRLDTAIRLSKVCRSPRGGTGNGHRKLLSLQSPVVRLQSDKLQSSTCDRRPIIRGLRASARLLPRETQNQAFVNPAKRNFQGPVLLHWFIERRLGHLGRAFHSVLLPFLICLILQKGGQIARYGMATVQPYVASVNSLPLYIVFYALSGRGTWPKSGRASSRALRPAGGEGQGKSKESRFLAG